MSIHTMKLVFVPLISVFVIISAYSLNKQPNVFVMIIPAALLFITFFFDRACPKLKYAQILLLGIFHYVSHLNWCLLLYYFFIFHYIQHKNMLNQMLPISVYMILQYSFIRLSYNPLTTYNSLVTIFDLFASVIIVYSFYMIVCIDTEKQNLSRQNDYLLNHDSLTGLLNYEGYMKFVRDLTEQNTPFQLVLLDINNFKSLNAQDITSANEILIRFSQSIRNHFVHMLAAARYAGDRFVILLPSNEKTDRMMTFQELGIEVTYSVTRFPDEASSLQEVISRAEERIFQMRQESWKKSQDDFMRSAKMKTVGELAAGMAHEIRNPLTSIKGFIQLSKMQKYNIEPWYDVIMGEITRVGELTAEFLQFSKPHVSNMKVDSLSSCMNRVFSLCESEAASRGHTFTMNLPDEPVMVFMDRDKMIQVLINLIRNSFQAMERPGYVHFLLRKSSEMAVVEVRDTGKGIPPDAIEQIFDPFYTTKEEGTGLGLSLCQKIVEDHGGSISVDSVVNRGTLFTIRLPIADKT